MLKVRHGLSFSKVELMSEVELLSEVKDGPKQYIKWDGEVAELV